MAKKIGTEELKKIAKETRMQILKMLATAGSGHTGGSLSCVEIILSLYASELRHDPKTQNGRTETGLFFRRAMAAPPFMPYLAILDIFPKKNL